MGTEISGRLLGPIFDWKSEHEVEIVGLDFESFYDTKDKYTLKLMSTSEYVRDPRFKAHGASLYRNGKYRWVTHNELPTALAEIPWHKVALLCHNTAFDGFVLSDRYGHVPQFYLDTLSMSRAAFGLLVSHELDAVAERLGVPGKIKGVLAKTDGVRDLDPELEEQIAEYAVQDMVSDVEVFYELIDTYPEEELNVIDVTIRAFCDPRLQINVPLLKECLNEERAERDEIVNKLGVDKTTLSSNPQFAELLRARGIEPPMKRSPRTGKKTYAFAKADLAFQALQVDPRVKDLIEARLLIKSTIKETRAARLLDHGDPGPLPVLMNYCQARSMRWSGGDKMNPQNLPRGSKLRQGIVPPPGYRLVVVDSAQIEARLLAWLAGQDDLLEVFRNKGDPYARMAERIFQRPIEKKSDERQLGKVCILGLGYGMGVDKFAYTVRAGLIAKAMEIDDVTAQRAVDLYRSTNTRITELWSEFDGYLHQMVCGYAGVIRPELMDFEPGRVWMPNGLALHFSDLTAKRHGNRLYDFSYMTRDGRTKIYGAKLVENVIQCLARIVIAEQTLKIAKRYFVALLAHDEVVYLAKESEADVALAYGLECLSLPPRWCKDAPLAAEGGHADYYAKF